MSNYENYYETYVVKNPTEKTIPRKFAGGEITAWGIGHQLRMLCFYREALEKIAERRTSFPSDYAARFLDVMKAYEGKHNAKVNQTIPCQPDDRTNDMFEDVNNG